MTRKTWDKRHNVVTRREIINGMPMTLVECVCLRPRRPLRYLTLATLAYGHKPTCYHCGDRPEEDD